MFNKESLDKPYAIIEKDGDIHFFSGNFLRFDKMDDLEKFYKESNYPIIFITPFSIAKECGHQALGNEKILILQATFKQKLEMNHINSLIHSQIIDLDEEIYSSISDDDFKNMVTQVQNEEIMSGNVCQVVLSRKFKGKIKNMNNTSAIVLFSKLLKQKGQYMTFLFSDDKGNFFVGATPERQLEIKNGKVIKNPIAGTMPKGKRKGFEERLIQFLNNQKEINELAQVLDEELKIMTTICPNGGKVFGPFLCESGAVIHTEYHLVGQSSKSPVKALKESFHAPTLVGSPIESAFRVITKYEKESRRYYGGEFGLIKPNGDMDSAIVIRTAEIDSLGNVFIQAGAGIVRDSVPENEVNETRVKADGLLSALKNDSANFTKSYLESIDRKIIDPILSKRNEKFSRFHFEDQNTYIKDCELKDINITIINNEDNFANVLGHMSSCMGCSYKIIDTFDYSPEKDSSEIVILGPGPGDINDESNPRMQKLLKITRTLLDSGRPILGICLGHQSISKALGLTVVRQDIPTQGVQMEIDYLGSKEKVGFYNSFIPYFHKTLHGIEMNANEKGEIISIKGNNLIGLQFHPESAMSQNGYRILKNALLSIIPTESLSVDEINQFVQESTSNILTTNNQSQFLLNLNKRGYNGSDIANFVKALYREMPRRLYFNNAIDICGTGGSGLPRINTSTISAFISASCGATIAKHGNRAASGRFGSFDLLEALGINIEAKSKRLEELYKDTGLAFIFAQKFHPAIRYFSEARKTIGTKTIFNLLGPLLNPAKPDRQIIGVSNKDDMSLIINASKILGKKHVMVICGSDGLDEVTLTGETYVMELKNGEVTSYNLNPADFGIKPCSFEHISGGDKKFNLDIAKEIIGGKCKTKHLDLILANTALILKFTGVVDDLKSGVKMAKEALKKGAVKNIFDKYKEKSCSPTFLQKIAIHKVNEIENLKKKYPLETLQTKIKRSNRNFKNAIQDNDRLSLIAEIKISSPTQPGLYKGEMNVSEIATCYEKNGVSAISVLTDEKYFEGSFENLSKAIVATDKTPILMKDFIIDPYQIYLGRHFGADAILLIVALLDKSTLEHFINLAHSLDMDCLVEVHDKDELETALEISADIIGINNRDLETLKINTKTVLDLLSFIPDGIATVAESGYDEDNVSMISGKCDGVLIGSSILSKPNVQKAVGRLISPRKTIKICGITDTQTAKFCSDNGINMVGLNFVSSSKRYITLQNASEIRPYLNRSLVVGIFQNHSIEEVNQISDELNLDYVQLSGNELPAYCSQINKPIIKTIKLNEDVPDDMMNAFNECVEMFILDGPTLGSGESYDYKKIDFSRIKRPFFVAGGITPANAVSAIKSTHAIGVDLASGVETNGKKDIKLISKLINELRDYQC